MASGQWASSTRRQRLPRDWAKRVAQVHRRSRNRCELLVDGRRCYKPANGGVDHKLGPDDHRLEALQDLCKQHHDQKTQNEAQAARATRKRPRAPHPGLLQHRARSTDPGG